MKLKELVSLRLVNQHISTGRFTTVKEIAGWMGALQAQDYAMSKWAFGVRLPGCTERTVNDAISNGEIIRTHLLRPTWHYVSSDDARWMFELSSPRIKASISNLKHKEMAYYFSAQIRIHDPAEYERYLENFDAIFSRYQGKFLAIDESPTLLEGEWNYTKTVLVSFESREAFEAWYFSKDYQEILRYRLNAAECDTILIKGV